MTGQFSVKIGKLIMGNRERLIEAISSEVFIAFTEQTPIDINSLAIALSSRYPQSGMPIDVICGQIETSLKTLTDDRPDTTV